MSTAQHPAHHVVPRIPRPLEGKGDALHPALEHSVGPLVELDNVHFGADLIRQVPLNLDPLQAAAAPRKGTAGGQAVSGAHAHDLSMGSGLSPCSPRACPCCDLGVTTTAAVAAGSSSTHVATDGQDLGSEFDPRVALVLGRGHPLIVKPAGSNGSVLTFQGAGTVGASASLVLAQGSITPRTDSKPGKLLSRLVLGMGTKPLSHEVVEFARHIRKPHAANPGAPSGLPSVW